LAWALRRKRAKRPATREDGDEADLLHRETVKVLGASEVRGKLTELGLDLVLGTPAELAAVIAREIPQWAKVIKGAGIRLSE